MRIAILGAGRLGQSLGTALRTKGHHIVHGVWQPQAGEPGAKTVDAAIAGAEMVVIATPWTVTEALVCEHAPALAGKIVIDATNPINASGSRLALGFDTSGAELLQSHAQGATVFKAFNAVGAETVAEPALLQGRAAICVAGPSGVAKKRVFALVADLGFEPVDAGDLRAARLLEPLGMLRLRLEETEGRGRDFAFLLTPRERRPSETVCSMVEVAERKAG
jgi:predicted dinucleotide-binding enzyme